MNKIICEVCGTKYPDSAEQCPICGNIRQDAQNLDAQTAAPEEEQISERPAVRGGRFSKSNVRKRNKNLPVYEEEEPEVQEEEDAPYEEDMYEDETREKSSTLLNVFLVLVILALLAVTAYIGLEYVLPNLLPSETLPPATQAPTEAPTEEPTEEPTIPCQELIFQESNVLLEEEGQQWLMNVQVLPADTTDSLVFTSSDELVAVVDAEGKVTVVGEGTAVITATCGKLSVESTVVCVFEQESTEATEEPGDDVTEEPTEEATEAPTEGPTEPLKDVKLAIKGVPDLTFRQAGQTHQVKMDCDLKTDEVTWTSENEKVATVDENGLITRVGKGRTNIIVKYGEQEITIIIRCP